MRLRSTILLGVLGVLIALVVATVLVISLRLEGDARRQIVADLERAGTVFTDLNALRRSLHRSETQTVAQEPRLKAVLGTSDIDRATIVDVADEMQKAGGADLFLLLDARGRLLVDTAEPTAVDLDLTGQPVVRAALADGEASGVWTQAQQVLEVHARRLGFGEGIALASTGLLSEGAGENLFLVFDGALHTTPVSAALLNGITRNTIFHIAKDLGLEIVQKRITRDEVYIADEAFFTGTAAEVTPIRELDRIELGKGDYVGSRGPITEKIQTAFFDIVNGRNPQYAHWLTKV